VAPVGESTSVGDADPAADVAPTLPPDPNQVWFDDLRSRFLSGQEAYREGRWTEAAELALSVYGDIGGPNNLYYAAECYHRAGDSARSVNIYAEYVDAATAEGLTPRPLSSP
jgi:hypothetical protein